MARAVPGGISGSSASEVFDMALPQHRQIVTADQVDLLGPAGDERRQLAQPGLAHAAARLGFFNAPKMAPRAAGVMPSIRPAAPKVRGRTRSSFSVSSAERPPTPR